MSELRSMIITFGSCLILCVRLEDSDDLFKVPSCTCTWIVV